MSRKEALIALIGFVGAIIFSIFFSNTLHKERMNDVKRLCIRCVEYGYISAKNGFTEEETTERMRQILSYTATDDDKRLEVY